MNIVLVEDNDAIALLEVTLLDYAGHVVDHHDTADDELFTTDFWADKQVAIIDLMLAGSKRNGLHLADWLHENIGDAVRMVLCSALVHILEQIPPYLGAVILRKPFDPERLPKIVEGTDLGDGVR